MAMRFNIIRIAACLTLCATIFVTPTMAFAQLLAAAAPLSDNYSWDTEVVASGGPGYGDAATSQPVLAKPAVNEPAAAESNNAPVAVGQPTLEPPSTDKETELAKRVEALEEYIRQQKAAASAAETLPPPAKTEKKVDKDAGDKKAEAKVEECVPKKMETIIKPTFTPTGRILFDGVTYDDDPDTTAFFNTDRDNELGFRIFRIGAKGSIYENLNYKMEVEIRGTNSAITYKDIYMEQQSLPVIGHFRAGHFDEPISLEQPGSDLFLTFMERSPATQTFAPARKFGVMAWDTVDECEDTTWFAGLFRADSPDSPANTGEWRSDNNDWCFDARVAWLPYYDEPSNGRYLVHLGGSYSFRHIGGLTPGATINQNTAYSTLNGLAEFTTRSWVGSQAPIGLGAEADSNQWNQLDAEFVTIWGAASLQSEYFQVLMNSGEQFNGGYAFLSYFLTGDHRGYNKEEKIISRVTPLEPFFLVNTASGHCCGWGAWELAIGYSWVNLDDGHDTVVTVPANSTNRRRGFNNDIVLGVNWYQNPWSRVDFDYEHEIVNFVDAGVPTSNANIFGIRWQVDW